MSKSAVEERILRAAQTINTFHGNLSGLAGAIKAKVEELQRQATTAPEPTPDLTEEFAQLDEALERLSGAGAALESIAGSGGGTQPSGVTPIGDKTDPRGSGPEGGVAVPPGSVPSVPNVAAPGAAITPTGSHDTGPGGQGPALPQGGFQTTLSGEGTGQTIVDGTPGPTGTQLASPGDIPPAQDAPLASPGQGGVPPEQVFPAGQESGISRSGDSVPAPVTQGPEPEESGQQGDSILVGNGGDAPAPVQRQAGDAFREGEGGQ